LWFRHPKAEQAARLQAQEGQASVRFQEEVSVMAKQILKCYEDELNERWQERLQVAERLAEKRGYEKGWLKGIRLSLLRFLRKRFGPVSNALRQRIAGASLDSINRALDQVLDISDPEQLQF